MSFSRKTDAACIEALLAMDVQAEAKLASQLMEGVMEDELIKAVEASLGGEPPAGSVISEHQQMFRIFSGVGSPRQVGEEDE